MKFKLVILFLLISFSASAQNIHFAHKMVRKLSSRRFWGRGYTKDGMHKAEEFLIKQFEKYGVAPMDSGKYDQVFSYPINTFPGKMELAINGVPLKPGQDFILSADSRGFKGNVKLEKNDTNRFIEMKDKVIMVKQPKLTFSAAQKVSDYTGIILDETLQKETPDSINVDIENKFIPDFKTANICGLVKGTEKPDSIIVYTAHYDHLGGLGDKTYFPGANDNASGVTQVLSLAKYYAVHPQPYTMAFILFSGEEAGLLGSTYFTQHPLIPLKNIRFLVNLDLEGTGVDGITVVNATVFPNEFNLLKKVNDEGKFLVKINSRGKAPNSDHYLFSEKGVPAIYWYTLGGIKAYHDIYDRSKTLPLTVYENMFKLILNFNAELMHSSKPY
jgi:aminopeptidase YwaD